MPRAIIMPPVPDEVPISLYLDIERGKKADLEVVRKAAVAFVAAVRDHRQPGPVAYLDQLHRAAELDHAHEHASVYAPHERIQQESREPTGRSRAALRPLQHGAAA